MQANTGILGERTKTFEEKQARLAKMEGLELKGDFERRRPGWGNSENKAACFERRHADHFKAQFPIWIKKKGNCRKKENRKRGKRKMKRGEKVSNVCVSR